MFCLEICLGVLLLFVPEIGKVYFLIPFQRLLRPHLRLNVFASCILEPQNYRSRPNRCNACRPYCGKPCRASLKLGQLTSLAKLAKYCRSCEASCGSSERQGDISISRPGCPGIWCGLPRDVNGASLLRYDTELTHKGRPHFDHRSPAQALSPIAVECRGFR